MPAMHDEPPPRLVKRPHHRRIFKDRGHHWLVIEPHRLGLAGASILATVALIVYSLAGGSDAASNLPGMLVGAGATFVVGYAAIGLFVWYLLHVAYTELGPPPEQEHRRRSLLGDKKRTAAAAKSESPDEPATENVETTAESETPL